MSRSVLLLLLFASLFISCNQTTTTAHVGNRYTLELPDNFEKVNNLNKDASLQYQNNVKNVYVIAIDEPKEALNTALSKNGLTEQYPASLEGYSNLIVNGMESSIALKKLPPFEETKIDGKTARILSFEGVSSGNRIYWKLAFIEGVGRYYQIMVWTDAENRDGYEKEMAAIINSFKETGGK
jgi:hypothetical protein